MSRSLSPVELSLIQQFPVNSIPMSRKKSPYPIFATKRYDPHTAIPLAFDGRRVWGKYLPPPPTQGNCGSCWVFSAITMLSTRFGIRTKRKIPLSINYIFFCNTISIFLNPDIRAGLGEGRTIQQFQETQKYQCYGDFLVSALYFLYYQGVADASCGGNTDPISNVYLPYFSQPARRTLKTCNNLYTITRSVCGYSEILEGGDFVGRPIRFYNGFVPYKYILSDLVQTIQQDILQNGPVATTFECYSDFWTFDAKTSIYKKSIDAVYVSGHSVVIVGWGTENGTDYWIVQNSWGEEWGDGGFFRIIREINECGIETGCIGMLPKLHEVSLAFYWNDLLLNYDVDKDQVEEMTQVFQRFITSYGLEKKMPLVYYSKELCRILNCNTGEYAITNQGYPLLFSPSFPGVDLQLIYPPPTKDMQRMWIIFLTTTAITLALLLSLLLRRQ